MIKTNELLNPHGPKRKAYFLRVPEEIYLEVQRIAAEQRRSITLQGQILLGAAINRDLVSPEDVETK